MHICGGAERKRERSDVAAVKFAGAGSGQDQVELCPSGNQKADVQAKAAPVPQVRSKKPTLPSPCFLSATALGTKTVSSRSSR